MNTKTGNAERFGRGLGRMWRGYMRRERRVASWLIARGLPAKATIALLWVVKLAVFGAMLYSALWLTLLLIFMIAAAWAVRHENTDVEDDWPFTTLDDLRKTPGYDPVPYNDVEHPDFPDERDG